MVFQKVKNSELEKMTSIEIKTEQESIDENASGLELLNT